MRGTTEGTNMRKTLLALPLAAMLGVTTPVYGLGLGNIDANSSLNERLSARIGLLSAGNTNVDNIDVSLASDAAFEQAGIQRPFYLSKLEFDVRRANGETFVEVTSREAMKEPFLDFLIEVSWPQGRLRREYTVLLDPPTYAGASGPAAS